MDDDDRVTPSPIDKLVHPLRIFAANRIAGGILLMLAAVAAIIWANSGWADSYHAFLHAELAVGFEGFALSKSVHHWINDGLMGVFFFTVGLEIKREILAGELSTVRKAILPIFSAAGGMAVPALLYVALNPGEPAVRGWGVPMATDIAFALGVLALLGDRIPGSLKVFLTALAIVDDIGAILVIALFYTESIAVHSLTVGGVLISVSLAANLLGVRNPVTYFLVGTAAWVAFLKSGVHATLAAVLMALTIPARTRLEGQSLLDRLHDLMAGLKEIGLPRGGGPLSPQQRHALDQMAQALEQATAPLQRVEEALHPFVTFVVLPVFALANAGVTLGAGLGATLASPVSLGIILGLFVGKQVGVLGLSWLASRLGLASLPEGVSWPQLYGVGLVAGIGFTMSLFIAGLAFGDPSLHEAAKLGVLSASLVSGAAGYVVLRGVTRRPADG